MDRRNVIKSLGLLPFEINESKVLFIHAFLRYRYGIQQ